MFKLIAKYSLGKIKPIGGGTSRRCKCRRQSGTREKAECQQRKENKVKGMSHDIQLNRSYEISHSS